MEGYTAEQSQAYQEAAAAYGSTNFNGQTITANNVALDTDGSQNPGWDPDYQLDGKTSYTSSNGQSLNSFTDYYVAVPTSAKIPPGTPILVRDTTTGQSIQAIAGDNGATGWGEMSIATAQALGLWSPNQSNKNSINPQNHGVTFTIGTKSQ